MVMAIISLTFMFVLGAQDKSGEVAISAINFCQKICWFSAGNLSGLIGGKAI